MTGDDRFSRRDFIKFGAAAGGAAVAGTQLVETAFANRHPAPRPTSLPYLDRNMCCRCSHPGITVATRCR
jgi:anaerobic selenocysteine-containing dehydrogenase